MLSHRLLAHLVDFLAQVLDLHFLGLAAALHNKSQPLQADNLMIGSSDGCELMLAFQSLKNTKARSQKT